MNALHKTVTGLPEQVLPLVLILDLLLQLNYVGSLQQNIFNSLCSMRLSRRSIMVTPLKFQKHRWHLNAAIEHGWTRKRCKLLKQQQHD